MDVKKRQLFRLRQAVGFFKMGWCRESVVDGSTELLYPFKIQILTYPVCLFWRLGPIKIALPARFYMVGSHLIIPPGEFIHG